MISVAIAGAFLAVGCIGDDDHGHGRRRAVSVTELTADQPGVAPNVAPSLVNAWGIVPFNGAFWISDAGTGKVAILGGAGVPSSGRPASGAIDLGEGTTGVAVTDVAPTDTAFRIPTGCRCKPAQLIFASESGKLLAVNTELSVTGGFVVVDQSGVGASYKGVAVLHGSHGPLILAADFHNGRVDVFNASFAPATSVSFGNPRALPAGFAPFNVMVFDDTVYVAYAKQDADKADEVAGPGLGFVVAFDTTGKVLRLAKGAPLNAPWGMALADDFAGLSHALLVGNFGDGHVTAFDPDSLKQLGQLRGRTGRPIAIDGLWGLAFGAGVTGARGDGLYFAAGPDDEAHGLFGVIAPASGE